MAIRIEDLGDVHDEMQNLGPLFDTTYAAFLDKEDAAAALMTVFADRFSEFQRAVHRIMTGKEAA